jgi:hypothetical protein
MTAVTRRLRAGTRTARRTAALAAGSLALIAATGPGVAQAASCTKPVQRHTSNTISTTELSCANFLFNHGWVRYKTRAGRYYLWFPSSSKGAWITPAK